MMKRFIRLMTCLIAGLLMCTMVVSSTACSCGGNENAEDIVKFFLWDSGWGTDGYQAIVDGFNAKAEAEGLGFTVEFEFSSDQTGIANEFSSGTSDVDVFINPIRNVESYVYLEPLDDVLNSTYGNETKTIRQKIRKTQLDAMEYEGSIGMLPVVSQVSAIVYNKALFAAGDFAVPRTTDELIALCEDPDFNNTEHKAWIHFADGSNGYYPYVMDVWTAQYDGHDVYKKKQQLVSYTQPNGVQVATDPTTEIKDVLAHKDGRYYMLQVLDAVLGHETVQSASNAQNFTTAQTAFLNGQAMMMVNGNWLGSEMQKNDGAFDGEKFGMMKAPIISEIINNTKDGSIADDAELCAVIDAVDAGKTWAEANLDVTEADYNRIVEARGMVVSGGCASGMYIANYSNVKEKAKKFVQYFYSDEAGLLWAEKKNNELVADYDDPTIREKAGYYDDWSTWDKEVDKLYKETTYPIGAYRTRSNFWILNGKDQYLGVDAITTLTSTNTKDIKSADEIWAEIQNNLTKNWTLWAAALEG